GRRRIVTAVRQAVLESQLETATDDLRFRHHLQRRVDAKALALYAPRRRQRSESLESGDELGAAIRVARVVEHVDADEDVVGTHHLGPPQRERQEHRVANGHVRRWNLGRYDMTVFRYRRR